MLNRNYTAHAPEFTFLHTLTEAFTLHSIPTGNVTFKQIFTDSVTFELCGFKVKAQLALRSQTSVELRGLMFLASAASSL